MNTVPITQTNYTSFIFSVRSCGEVRLIFSTNTTTLRPSYHIVIGRVLWDGSVVSRITRCYTLVWSECEKTEISSTNILSCNEVRSFWITWNNIVMVGTGDIEGNGVLMTAEYKSDIPIDLIGLESESVNNITWSIKLGKYIFL